MVDDLLDVSRISRGKITLQKQLVKLADVISDAVEITRPLIEGRKHELTVSMPPDAMWLDADPTRLAQVVYNLLNNAAKYTEKGGHIWLAVSKEGHEAILRVRDTGIGISPEMLTHVFELFAQLDRALDRSQGGLGIGLTLVRRIVEMHGGSIYAFSEGTGKGSVFEVRLPLPLEKKQGDGDATKTEHAVASCPARRILVADDNEDFAECCVRLFRRRGHAVAFAHDGPTALEVAQSFQPQVAFLDIGLPGINGHEVARQLRHVRGLDHVLLVALTGYGQEEDQRRSLEAGFNFHLTKPTGFKELESLLAHYQGK
jgi:CheY-like chemotaxis protein/two-component sensor histidine kinase